MTGKLFALDKIVALLQLHLYSLNNPPDLVALGPAQGPCMGPASIDRTQLVEHFHKSFSAAADAKSFLACNLG